MIDNKTIKNTAILASLVFACKNMVNCMPTVYDDGVINITVDDGCDKQMHKSRSHQKQCGYHNVHKGVKKHQIPHKQYGSVNDRMKDILKHKMTEENFKVLFDNCVFSDEIDVSGKFFDIHTQMACNQLAYMLHLFNNPDKKDILQPRNSKIVIRSVSYKHDPAMKTLLDNIRRAWSSAGQEGVICALNLITNKNPNCPSPIYLTVISEALYNAIIDDYSFRVIRDSHINKIVDLLTEYKIINDGIAYTLQNTIGTCEEKMRDRVIDDLHEYILAYKNLTSRFNAQK